MSEKINSTQLLDNPSFFDSTSKNKKIIISKLDEIIGSLAVQIMGQ
jgi:hypothetical protein